MVLYGVLDTDEPDNCNDELAGDYGVVHGLVEDHPQGAVVLHGGEGICVCSIKSDQEVKGTTDHVYNPPNPLEAEKPVNNGPPLTGAVPDIEEADIEDHIDDNLACKKRKHRKLTDKGRK